MLLIGRLVGREPDAISRVAVTTALVIMMGSLAFFFFSRIELVVAFLAAAGVFHVVGLRELWGVLRRSEEHASPPDAHNFRLVRLFVTVHWSVYLGPRLFLMAGWIDNITEELCYLTLDAIDKVTMRQRPPAALGGSPIPPRPPRPRARPRAMRLGVALARRVTTRDHRATAAALAF